MNSRHSKVTDWGLSHASVRKRDIILDVGCGGGRTVSKLAAIATQGKVYGIDHSAESAARSDGWNWPWWSNLDSAAGGGAWAHQPGGYWQFWSLTYR